MTTSKDPPIRTEYHHPSQTDTTLQCCRHAVLHVQSGAVANTSHPNLQAQGAHLQRSTWISRWMNPLISTLSSIGPMTCPLRLMLQRARRGEIFFYWLTRGQKKRDPRDHLSTISPAAHVQNLAETLPGYSVNTASEDTVEVASALIPSQGGVDTPSLGEESSNTSLSKKCACIACLAVGGNDGIDRGPWHCRFAGCSYMSIWWDGYRNAHEKRHYRQGSLNSLNTFDCPVQNCRFSSKRWADLHRHTTAKHCSNPTMFACSVIGCKYYGEGNGFIRKDKLMDHYKNVHKGQKLHGQPVRAIKPAPAPVSSYAKASGSSSIGALGQ